MNERKRVLILVAAVLTVGLAAGYWFGRTGGMPAAPDAQANAGRKPLFYRNPMNPAITSPVPAKDEMGMDYLPVYADGAAADEPAGTVSIDPVTVQNIGLRTARAGRRTLSRHIRTIGRIDYDEERLSRLFPKVEGWIEKLYASKTGEAVKKGTILLEIYSPQLVATQEEYLLALQNRDTLAESPFEEIRRGAVSLADAARERLVLLDVPAHQIRELEQTRKIKKTLHIHSPFAGVVTHIGARQGQYVTPQTELYRIADLSRVWVYVDVYEDDLAWAGIGDAADMQVTALPGRVFQGKVAAIYPYLEAKTRTARVRLEFRNADLALKPDMYANVVLHASRQIDAITVPSEAVVRSGARELVFVVTGPGRFAPREVKLGVSSEGQVQVLDGLEAGEEIVVSAQFLIDSESKLREAVAKMLEANKTPAAPSTAPAADGAAAPPAAPTPPGHQP